MGRKSNKFVQIETDRVRRALENPDNMDKNDTEIIELLEIPQGTYHKYKARIRQQDTQAWEEIAKESLESAALKVKKALDYCTKISKDIANDPTSDARARLEGAKKVVECQMMLYRMLKEGPTSKSITIPNLPIIKDGTNRRMESLGSSSVTA